MLKPVEIESGKSHNEINFQQENFWVYFQHVIDLGLKAAEIQFYPEYIPRRGSILNSP